MSGTAEHVALIVKGDTQYVFVSHENGSLHVYACKPGLWKVPTVWHKLAFSKDHDLTRIMQLLVCEEELYFVTLDKNLTMRLIKYDFINSCVQELYSQADYEDPDGAFCMGPSKHDFYYSDFREVLHVNLQHKTPPTLAYTLQNEERKITALAEARGRLIVGTKFARLLHRGEEKLGQVIQIPGSTFKGPYEIAKLASSDDQNTILLLDENEELHFYDSDFKVKHDSLPGVYDMCTAPGRRTATLSHDSTKQSVVTVYRALQHELVHEFVLNVPTTALPMRGQDMNTQLHETRNKRTQNQEQRTAKRQRTLGLTF